MEHFTKKYPKTAKAIRYTGNALKVAHQAYNMARVVASIVNAEKKYHDVRLIKTPTAAVPTIDHLSAIPQGDTDQNRNGDSVAIKSIQTNLTIDNSNYPNIVRVVIFRDDDNENGVIPTVAQLYGSATPTWDALRNMNYPKRFKVLLDKTYTNDEQKPIKVFDWFKKFKMLKDRKGNPTRARHLTWTSGTDTQRGHLFMMCISNSVANHPVVYANTRIRYYDN